MNGQYLELLVMDGQMSGTNADRRELRPVREKSYILDLLQLTILRKQDSRDFVEQDFSMLIQSDQVLNRADLLCPFIHTSHEIYILWT